MHIFNLKDRPSLIISEKDLLFRKNIDDEQMHRINLDNIQRISLQESDEEGFFLQIHMKVDDIQHSICLSKLEMPTNEILKILEDELHKKIDEFDLNLQAKEKNKNNNIGLVKTTKRTSLITILSLSVLALALFHKFYIPNLESLPKDSLKKQYEPTQAYCSVNAKVALKVDNKSLLIQHYCGVLGLWRETASQKTALRYQDLEFSSLTYQDYLKKANLAFSKQAYQETLVNLDKVLYLKTKSAKAYLLLGEVYFELGKTQKAFKATKNALYLEKNLKTLLQIAKIEVQLNRQDQAIQHYELALKYGESQAYIYKELTPLYWHTKAYVKLENSLKNIYLLKPNRAKNFLNYFESTLITQTKLEKEQIEQFLLTFKNDKQSLIIFDILRIIKHKIAGEDVLTQMQAWYINYDKVKLNWSFTELFLWLDSSQLSQEEKHEIKKLLGFFIAYQQIYKLENQKKQEKL